MKTRYGTEAIPTAKMAALAIRESLLKVCRHYQEPGLGKNYANVARYYEKQVAAIAYPGEQMPAAQQPSTDELRP